SNSFATTWNPFIGTSSPLPRLCPKKLRQRPAENIARLTISSPAAGYELAGRCITVDSRGFRAQQLPQGSLARDHSSGGGSARDFSRSMVLWSRRSLFSAVPELS